MTAKDVVILSLEDIADYLTVAEQEALITIVSNIQNGRGADQKEPSSVFYNTDL